MELQQQVDSKKIAEFPVGFVRNTLRAVVFGKNFVHMFRVSPILRLVAGFFL
jgi:hypothetical protein